jgi:protein-arginine kinase
MDEEIKEEIKEEITEEIKEEIAEGTNEWELFQLRNTRNSLLQLTDKYLLSDYPISDEKRYEIIEYRQYLRNFININQEAILNGEKIEILPIPF